MEWNNKVAAMHGLDMAFPFLDRDLISFLMSIPGEMQSWAGVPKAILREAVRDIVPEPIRCRDWKADFTSIVNEAMRSELPDLMQLIRPDGMSATLGYVTGEKVRNELLQTVPRFQRPTCDTAWNISNLLGLELWLDVFWGEQNATSDSRNDDTLMTTDFNRPSCGTIVKA
jgi:asparagine synthase (glutamine-hydrolysing)